MSTGLVGFFSYIIGGKHVGGERKGGGEVG